MEQNNPTHEAMRLRITARHGMRQKSISLPIDAELSQALVQTLSDGLVQVEAIGQGMKICLEIYSHSENF